jgi:hypothetical protein
MKSTKCSQCGLVYWSTDPHCKRCGLPTPEPNVYDAPAAAQYFEPQPSPMAYTNDFEHEELLKHLRKDSSLFYFIGGLQVLAWFFIGNLLIVDAVFNIGLALVALKFKSRIAAILLLCLTILSALMVVLAIVTGVLRLNIFVPLVMLGRLAASIRIIITTFKLQAYKRKESAGPMPPLPPVFDQEEPQPWGAPISGSQWQPE